MNVPKWLIPAISIIAALALGVAMAFVGANFASKQTKEVAAQTEVDPVIGPAASGVTSDQAKALFASKTVLSSPKIGNKRVTLPGALPATTPFEREVETIAAGGPRARALITGGALPSASSVGVSPYTPSATNDDPCAPVDQKIPIGCPGGLRSAIFADSAAPPLAFSSAPFSAPCATTPQRTTDPTRVSAAILISVTQPVTFDVQYWAPLSSPFDGWREIDNIQPDPDSAAAYTTAIHANAAPSAIPTVKTCVNLPNVLLGKEYYYAVVLHATDGERPNRTEPGFNTSGIPTEQPLQVVTFGNDGLIVYGDYRDDEQLTIRAFLGTGATSTSCDHTYFAHELTPVLTTSSGRFPLDHDDTSVLDEPSDVHNRTTYGFEAPAGSSVIICGRWFPAAGSPSWTRTTALRTSVITAQAPDAILPNVYVSGNSWYHNPTAANVTVTMATAEGEPCGQAVIYRDETDLAPSGVLACDLHGSGSEIDPRGGYLANVGFAGDLRITVTVNYYDGHSGSRSEVLPTSEARPTSCSYGDPRSLCDHLDDFYPVDIPYYYLPNHADPEDGRLGVDVRWHLYGSSGLQQWEVLPQTLQVPVVPDPDTVAPLLDTDYRVIASATTGPQDAQADMTIKSSTSADYTMTLVGINGPGCSIDGAPLTTSGHVGPGYNVGAYIPHLCWGTLYWATVTLTNSHGTTVWGHAAPGSGWLGDLVTTPQKRVNLFVQETVAAPSGHVVQYADFTLGGQEIDPTHSPAACYSSGNIAADRHTLQFPDGPQRLHIHYQLLTGSRNSSGQCVLSTTASVPAPVDAYFDVDLAAVAANPAGITYTQGPLTVLIRVFPIP